MLDALFVGGGVTSPQEARLASSGLLALQGPTALDVRTGVMAGPGSTALVTGTSDTGPMTVQIGQHVAVTTRGTANGPYIGPTLEAAAKVNIAVAPASGQTRIDVVYVKQQDGNSGVPSPDVTTAPLYGVLTGTAATTGLQVKPDLSTIVGAVELATVTVAAGATSTNGSGVTIANTAKLTTTRGGVLPLRTEAELSGLTGFAGQTVFTLDKKRLWRHDGTAFRYAGGAPPPTYACAVQTGFAAYASQIPVAFQDGSGLCHLQGIVQVTTGFSTATPILALPSQVPATASAGEGFPLMVHNSGNGLTTIRVSFDNAGKLYYAEGTAVAAGSFIYLMGASWHPTTPGTTALA